MKITKEKQAEWKRLQSRGDIEILKRICGVSRTVVSLAINKGVGSPIVLQSINNYYINKAKEVLNESL